MMCLKTKVEKYFIGENENLNFEIRMVEYGMPTVFDTSNLKV